MGQERKLFTGANALLGGRQTLVPSDVLVCGPRIEQIGPAGSIDAARADSVVDLVGSVLLPGFVDGHCHLELTLAGLEHHVSVHSPPHRSLTEILEHLAQARQSQPRGWIIARSSFGLQHKVVEGRLPHKDELDWISPREPMVVMAGLHVACLNTAAITALGLDDLRSLPSWMDVDVDRSGPTGVFTEVWDRLPTHSSAEVMSALRAHARPTFSAVGTTSLSTISTSADDVRALHRLAKANELPFRVRFFVHVPRTASLEEVLAWGPESGFGDDMLRFGGAKTFIDGEGATAYGEHRDDTKWDRAELEQFVDAADRSGVQLLMHAVTPHAIRLVCEVINSIASRRRMNMRHRIEHGADFTDPEDIPLVAATPVRLVATPHFAVSDEGHQQGFQPLRQLIDAGFEVIGASDATGTVPDGISPLRNVSLAASRTAGAKPSPHRISALEGLRMFGEWAAKGVDEHHEKGTVEVGKLADFVVVDRDPLSVDSSDVEHVKVLSTFLGGTLISGAAK